MKRKWHIAAAALALTAVTAWADSPLPVTVSYDAAPAGAGPWQYTYTVENTSLGQPVSEFTIWFAHDAYRNLALATPNPPASAWNELVIQPDPLLSDAGYYDALSLLGGIPEGGLVSGFAVTFDWLGPGTPGAQPFDIIDPVTYRPIYSGTTVPEPAGLLLLALAGLLARQRS
jgi:MYXO-CTERM domain-containing protein